VKKAIVLAIMASMLMSGSAAIGAKDGCDDGKNRRVQMVNDTDTDIVRLYGSNIGADSWQEDVLGDSILRAGSRVTVNWDDGTCYCNYDFKAVYRDETTSIQNGVNVCKISSFRFHN
jgi:hypothetical protein